MSHPPHRPEHALVPGVISVPDSSAAPTGGERRSRRNRASTEELFHILQRYVRIFSAGTETDSEKFRYF